MDAASGSGCSSNRTGCFSDAAVDGLISCRGEGWRLIEAAWMVDAISEGMLESMMAGLTAIRGAQWTRDWGVVNQRPAGLAPDVGAGSAGGPLAAGSFSQGHQGQAEDLSANNPTTSLWTRASTSHTPPESPRKHRQDGEPAVRAARQHSLGFKLYVAERGTCDTRCGADCMALMGNS